MSISAAQGEAFSQMSNFGEHFGFIHSTRVNKKQWPFSSLFQNCNKLKCKPTYTYRIQTKLNTSRILLSRKPTTGFTHYCCKGYNPVLRKNKRCRMRIAIFTGISEKLLYLHTDNVKSILHSVKWQKTLQFLSRSLTLLPRSLKVKYGFEWEHTCFGKSTAGLFVCWPKQVPECNLFQLKTC